MANVIGLSPFAQSGGNNYTLCQEFDPHTDITWRRGNPLVGARVSVLPGSSGAQGAGQSLKLTYTHAQSEPPAAGHHLWFRDGGRPNAGIVTQYSSDVTYTNVVMHFMSGFGIVAQYTRGITFNNVSAETAKGSGRFCSCSADLLHFSGCSGLINVTGGRFVGSQDDGVNVHATHLQIVAQPAPTKIVLQFMQTESYGFKAFFAGDAVQFTRADTLASFGSGVVKRVTMQSVKGCGAAPDIKLPCQIMLELEAPLLGARLKQDVVENLAFTPNVSITGAYFSRIPTRGLLITTRGGVVITNNTIHSPLNPALQIADDAASWYESGPVMNVEFSNNVVVRRLTSQKTHARKDWPLVNVAPSNTKNATVHRNLHANFSPLFFVLSFHISVCTR